MHEAPFQQIGEMKSYCGFSRSPHCTAYVSHSHVFGVFAKKPFSLQEIAKPPKKSIQRENRVQNIFSKAL
jgi:hypothetical protein